MPTASSKSIPPAETQARVDPAGRLPRLFPSELFLVTAESRAGLRSRLAEVAAYLDRPHPAPLHDLAFTLSRTYEPGLECVGIVASSHADLRQKVAAAREKLDDASCTRIQNQSGIYYAQERLGGGKVAFLFPGENAQYVNMLAGLCMNFPEMRRTFDEADAACAGTGDGFLPSALNFPAPGADGSLSAEEEISQWEKAVVLVHTANTAMSKLLAHLELRPDAVLGHSFGELSALEMAGVLHPGEEAAERVRYGTSAYLHLRQLSREAGLPHGRLLSVGGAEPAHLEAILARFPAALRIAMENCPHQYILAAGGPEMEAVIAEADRYLTHEGAICARLPIERPYHTSFFEPAYPLERAYYEGGIGGSRWIPNDYGADNARSVNSPGCPSRQWGLSQGGGAFHYWCRGRSPGSRIVLGPPPSRWRPGASSLRCRPVAFRASPAECTGAACGLRPRLQWRGRDGI